MQPSNPQFRVYLENQILTATPEQLQMMLYDGMIRFAKLARQELEQNRFDNAQTHFERIDAIVCELHNGLRPDQEPELCEKYASLYNFISRKMLEANFKHNLEAIDDALRIMDHLRETWMMVMEKIQNEQSEESQLDRSLESNLPGESTGEDSEFNSMVEEDSMSLSAKAAS